MKGLRAEGGGRGGDVTSPDSGASPASGGGVGIGLGFPSSVSCLLPAIMTPPKKRRVSGERLNRRRVVRHGSAAVELIIKFYYVNTLSTRVRFLSGLPTF